MPHDEGSGQDRPQLAQQCTEGGFLFQGPCIHGHALGGQSPFIAHAYGMAVVVPAVRPRFLHRAAAVDFAVARDVEMVADVTEAPVADMVAAAGLEIQVPPLGGGGTMDDDERDGAHGYMQLCIPKTLPMAVATAMITLRMTPQVDVFFWFSIK